MVEERKYYSCMMKKHFDKELVMTKEDDENFESSAKCWICNNPFIEGDVKVRDHCYVTGKYKGAAHRDCNINVTLNCKIPIVFHNLKKYYAHHIMQELGKFDFKGNVIPNGLENYISFSLDNKVVFIDSFQFLNSSLESLIKSLAENEFNHFGQGFNSQVLDLVKQKGFYPY